MKIREFMAYVNESATVKMEYTDVTNFGEDKREWLRNRTNKCRQSIRVPHADENPYDFSIYPFDSKEEIYDIEIDMIDVGSDIDGEGVIYLITDYIKEHN